MSKAPREYKIDRHGYWGPTPELGETVRTREVLPGEVSQELVREMVRVLGEFAQWGPPNDGKKQESACWACDMGQAGYSQRGDGFHDDKCPVKDAQNVLSKLALQSDAEDKE